MYDRVSNDVNAKIAQRKEGGGSVYEGFHLYRCHSQRLGS